MYLGENESYATMRRRRFLKTVGAGTAIGIAGCTGTQNNGNNGDGQTESEDLPVVNIGAASAGSTGVLMDMILGEGLDRKHDLVFEPTRAGPSEVSQLVVNGGVDVGHQAPFQAASARMEGNNVSLFGPWLGNHTSLIVQPDSEYESWEDLQGESIAGLPEPTASYYHTTLRLSHLGMKFEEDFTVEQAGSQAMHSFFERGDVEAHVHFPPVMIPLLADGEIREIELLPNAFDDIYGNNLHFQNLSAYDDWLESNPDIAKRVQDVFIEAAEKMTQSPLDYLRADYTGTAAYKTDAHFELAAERTKSIYMSTWGEDDKQQIADQINELKDLGHLSQDMPSDVTYSL